MIGKLVLAASTSSAGLSAESWEQFAGVLIAGITLALLIRDRGSKKLRDDAKAQQTAIDEAAEKARKEAASRAEQDKETMRVRMQAEIDLLRSNLGDARRDRDRETARADMLEARLNAYRDRNGEHP